MKWLMPVQLLKIFNPLSAGLSLEFALKNKKNSILKGHKSRSGADIDLLFNYQFSTFFSLPMF